jgi:hypothetical protein
MPTHSGRTVMRAIWEVIWRIPSTHARPCSALNYRCAEVAYSGVTPSTVSVWAVPLMNKAW